MSVRAGLAALLLLLAGCAARRTTLGAGPGVVVLQDMPTGTTEVRPALVLEVSRRPPPELRLGFVSHATLGFHDARAMGDIYRWYLRTDGEDAGLRLLLLWPGMLVAPFFTASMEGGRGLSLRLAPTARAPSLEFGGQAGLWLHWSAPDWKADLTAGPWGGLEVPLGDRTSLGLRSWVNVPLVYSLTHGGEGWMYGGRAVVTVDLGGGAKAP